MVRLTAQLLIWGYKNRTKESPSVCSGGLFLWEAYVLGNALGFSEGTTFWGGIAKKAAHFFWQAIFLSCFFGAKKTTGKYRYSRVSFRSGDLAGFLPDDV